MRKAASVREWHLGIMTRMYRHQEYERTELDKSVMKLRFDPNYYCHIIYQARANKCHTHTHTHTTKNELPKLLILENSEILERVVQDACPSRVTLDLSVYKAYKNQSSYFTTLQHVILIKWGSIVRIFYPCKVSENQVAVLEKGGAGD